MEQCELISFSRQSSHLLIELQVHSSRYVALDIYGCVAVASFLAPANNANICEKLCFYELLKSSAGHPSVMQNWIDINEFETIVVEMAISE